MTDGGYYYTKLTSHRDEVYRYLIEKSHRVELFNPPSLRQSSFLLLQSMPRLSVGQQQLKHSN